MIVTADEVNRSFKGALDLLNSRAEGLKSFDMSERGFWRSFTAIWLTLPAYVVSLAFERLRLGLLQPDRSLLDNLWIDFVVALGHVGGFIALPVAMIWIARWFRLEKAYVPFVIVTNWISVIGMLVLSVPALRARTMTNLLDSTNAFAPPLARRLGREPDDYDVRAFVTGCMTAAAIGVFAWFDADGRADLGQLIDRAVAALGELAY